MTGWLGIGAPKGTLAEIVQRLNREVNSALADPAVKGRMADLGSEPLGHSLGLWRKQGSSKAITSASRKVG